MGAEPSLQPGSYILIKGSEGKYCALNECAQDTETIKCDRKWSDLTMTARFMVVDVNNPTGLVLMGSNNKFCAYNGEAIRCNREDISEPTHFYWNKHPDDDFLTLKPRTRYGFCSDLSIKIACIRSV